MSALTRTPNELAEMRSDAEGSQRVDSDEPHWFEEDDQSQEETDK